MGIWLVSRKSREKLLWWSPLRYFATPGYSSTVKKLKAGLHLRLRHQQNKHTQKHLLVLKKKKCLLSAGDNNDQIASELVVLVLAPGACQSVFSLQLFAKQKKEQSTIDVPSYAQHQLDCFEAKDGL